MKLRTKYALQLEDTGEILIEGEKITVSFINRSGNKETISGRIVNIDAYKITLDTSKIFLMGFTIISADDIISTKRMGKEYCSVKIIQTSYLFNEMMPGNTYMIEFLDNYGVYNRCSGKVLLVEKGLFGYVDIDSSTIMNGEVKKIYRRNIRRISNIVY